MVKITITENEREQRLDKFLKKYLPAAPLSFIYKAIRKDVKVNGKRKKEDYVLFEGDEVTLYVSDEDLAKLRPARKTTKVKKQFRVAYEDENLLICDKPAGLLTHGDKQEKTHHLANQVISYLTAKGDYDPKTAKTFVPAPVNRIDRNTAGLVVFAKNYDTLKVMNQVVRQHQCMRKFYRTIVVGEMTSPMKLTGHMNKDEARNRVSLQDEGKFMETDVVPLRCAGGYTLCQVEIHTGRTHQIRVQLASAGFPLLGDAKYGDPKVNNQCKKQWNLTTQFLLAHELRFADMPGHLAYMNGVSVQAKVPAKFQAVEQGVFSPRTKK